MNESIGRSQFTIQQEQIALVSVQSLVNSAAFLSATELLQASTGKIVVTGLGKSSYIAQKIAASMASLGNSAIFLHPSEAFHGDIGNIANNDILLALSFSGETKEVVKLAEYAKKYFDSPVISITGNAMSRLSLVSAVSLVLDIESEGCSIGVAPMASAVGTLALGDCLASAMTDPKIFSRKEFARFHPGGSLGLHHTPISEVMQTGLEVPVIDYKTDFTGAVEYLDKYGYGIVGLIDNEELVGVLTDGDVRRYVIVSKEYQASNQALCYASKNPVVVNVKISLADALEVMKTNKITSLFVKDRGIIGFIHMHSILKYLE